MKRSVPFGKPLVKSSDIRDIPMKQRSLMIFHSAIKSEQTKQAITQYDFFRLKTRLKS